MATSVQKQRASAAADSSASEASSATGDGGEISIEPPPKVTRSGVDREQISAVVVQFVLPVLMAIVAVVAGLLAIQRTRALIGWEATFTGSGHFVVTSCQKFDQWGPDQWHCLGRLAVDGELVEGKESTMVVSRGAMPSLQPYVGQQWDVFFSPAEGTDVSAPDFVYADQLQLSEIARLYISIFPRVMLSVGAAGWLLGWWFNRRHKAKPEDWWVNRLPGMQALQRRSAIWILVAAATYLVYRLIAYYLLGSVGVA